MDGVRNPEDGQYRGKFRREIPMISAQKASEYSAHYRLRDGRRIEIRALQRDDRSSLISAVEGSSDQSIYRRFFGARRHFTEQEISFFLDIDFVSHVALVAVVENDGQSQIAGGGRYIVVQPGQAEIAFIVVDQYQGQGLGTALMKHVGILACNAGVRELIAEVLPENVTMLKVFRSSGYPVSTTREPGVMRVRLQLPTSHG
jgi:RimJ/RimL family protein N-acetyltransferase